LAVRVGAAGKKASYTQSVALFGLAKASAADGEHGGNGINVAVDITEIAGKLTGAGASLDQLEVSIEQEDAGPNPAPVTVERISIYKQAVD
jgi:tyrosinase